MTGGGEYARYGGKVVQGFWPHRPSKCKQCGKEFLCCSGWAYRDNSGVFCSYSCMRIPQKEKEAKRREKYLANIRRYSPERDEAREKLSREQRIEECKAKIALYEARVSAAPRGTMQLTAARNRLYQWRGKLRIALEQQE